jgi:organic hydroperoxide reductase OsmC/OhrA
MGGKGNGQNPEQLFAMGYACTYIRVMLTRYSALNICVMHTACYLGALQMMAGKMGKKDAVKNAVIHANVHLGEAEELGGFGLAVDIKVEGVEDDELIQAGHDVRLAYSRIAPGAHTEVLFCDPLTMILLSGLPLQPCAYAWRSCQCFQGIGHPEVVALYI